MFIDPKNSDVKAFLPHHGIAVSKFQQILETIKQANINFYQSTPKHVYFYKMLLLNQEVLEMDKEFKRLPIKEKQEWQLIRNINSGDRGYMNRYFIAALKEVQPEIYTKFIEPHVSGASPTDTYSLELADDIDALLLSQSIPIYFECLANVSAFKKGVFSKLRRNYINFVESRMLYVLSEFLKAYENDFSIMNTALLNESHQDKWSPLKEILEGYCHRGDSNHHDPLSLESVNCLRSIDVSFFNIAMEGLLSDGGVLLGFRQLLPIIPDILDFTKNRLEFDNFWNRYQQHHFLFMRLPKEKKTNLEKCLQSLLPAQRVVWMGCLGKIEIQALLLPMVHHIQRFESVAQACKEITKDHADYPFALRVWQALQAVYHQYLQKDPTTTPTLKQMFEKPIHKEEAPHLSGPLSQEETEVDQTTLEKEKGTITRVKEKTFLVVDDSDRIRKMTIDVLKHSEIPHIFEANDGKTGWELLQKHHIDIVLCDWIMSEVDGMELLNRMMKDPRLSKVGFIMLTTVDDKNSIVKAISSGARGYLIKPFDRQHMFEQIFRVIEWMEHEHLHEKKNVQKKLVKPAF